MILMGFIYEFCGSARVHRIISFYNGILKYFLSELRSYLLLSLCLMGRSVDHQPPGCGGSWSYLTLFCYALIRT